MTEQQTKECNVLFGIHSLDKYGKQALEEVEQRFSELYINLQRLVSGGNTREFSIVKTKLEEAAMFMNKAISLHYIEE